MRCAHCRGCQGLQRRHGHGDALHDGLEQAVVVQGRLALPADLLHHLRMDRSRLSLAVTQHWLLPSSHSILQQGGHHTEMLLRLLRFCHCCSGCAWEHDANRRLQKGITWTACTGKLPAAVSPESMTQSVPSSTALATSVASARVGRGFLIILSSICVAVMTGLPTCNVISVKRYIDNLCCFRSCGTSAKSPCRRRLRWKEVHLWWQ